MESLGNRDDRDERGNEQEQLSDAVAADPRSGRRRPQLPPRARGCGDDQPGVESVCRGVRARGLRDRRRRRDAGVHAALTQLLGWVDVALLVGPIVIGCLAGLRQRYRIERRDAEYERVCARLVDVDETAGV